MTRKRMSVEEIKKSLDKLEGWKVDGENLQKRFEFKNFAESLDFINKVGEIAEKRDHHPDIYFGWGYAECSITTHDVGGLTHNDFKLAEAIEKI